MVLNNQSKTLENINDLTDKYAPLQCKKIALRPHSPWYTSALRREKRARRRGERVVVKESKDDPTALFQLTRNMMGNSGDKIKHTNLYNS